VLQEEGTTGTHILAVLNVPCYENRSTHSESRHMLNSGGGVKAKCEPIRSITMRKIK